MLGYSYNIKSKKPLQSSSSNHPSQQLPSCYPHLSNSTQQISRIYFYHVRKAGGSMIRNYLQKVCSYYNINLHMLEYNYASKYEEVGSRSDTLYVTNIRDPIERSISHYKYSERWDCQQLVMNVSFIPTRYNIEQPFNAWNDTQGFTSSPCDMPFSFTSCAVNCYIQAFSGIGCTTSNWYDEYNVAFDTLRRYNMVLVYEKFKDVKYVQAIENFFGGVQGFNEPSTMYCGEEAKEANELVPLSVTEFSHVFTLTKLNEMDNRLYNDFVSSCSWSDDDGKNDNVEYEYDFPIIDPSRFLSQENRTVIE